MPVQLTVPRVEAERASEVQTPQALEAEAHVLVALAALLKRVATAAGLSNVLRGRLVLAFNPMMRKNSAQIVGRMIGEKDAQTCIGLCEGIDIPKGQKAFVLECAIAGDRSVTSADTEWLAKNLTFQLLMADLVAAEGTADRPVPESDGVYRRFPGRLGLYVDRKGFLPVIDAKRGNLKGIDWDHGNPVSLAVRKAFLENPIRDMYKRFGADKTKNRQPKKVRLWYCRICGNENAVRFARGSFLPHLCASHHEPEFMYPTLVNGDYVPPSVKVDQERMRICAAQAAEATKLMQEIEILDQEIDKRMELEAEDRENRAADLRIGAMLRLRDPKAYTKIMAEIA